MKIHVSAECKALLDKVGGFELIARDREMEQSDLVGGPVGVISVSLSSGHYIHADLGTLLSHSSSSFDEKNVFSQI